MTHAVAEIAPESVTGTVVAEPDEKQYPNLVNLLHTLRDETTVDEDQDADEFVMGLMEQILSAETIDDIFAAQEAGAKAGKDFTNRPFLLKGENLAFRRSRLKTGFPFYAVMTVTEIATGDEVQLTCGGKTFMAVVTALRDRGYFNDDPAAPDGRPLVLIATGPEDGAYLSLKPFAGYYKPASARGKK